MSSKIDPAQEEFCEYLDFEIESEHSTILPLYHNCSLDNLKAYLRKKHIYLEECEIFPKKKCYAFYGASRYRAPGKDDKKGIKRMSESNAPACLILNTEHVDNLFRIYPFDTGSACNPTITGRTSPYDSEQIKSRLHVGKKHHRVHKVILHFFENLHNYIEGKIAMDASGNVYGHYDFPDQIAALSEIKELHKGTCAGDKREFCTEFIFDNIVPLNPEVLAGFFAPAAEIPKLVQQLNELGEKYELNGFKTKFYPSEGISTAECYKIIEKYSVEHSKEKLVN